jgi:hypothetical protein
LELAKEIVPKEEVKEDATWLDMMQSKKIEQEGDNTADKKNDNKGDNGNDGTGNNGNDNKQDNPPDKVSGITGDNTGDKKSAKKGDKEKPEKEDKFKEINKDLYKPKKKEQYVDTHTRRTLYYENTNSSFIDFMKDEFKLDYSETVNRAMNLYREFMHKNDEKAYKKFEKKLNK